MLTPLDYVQQVECQRDPSYESVLIVRAVVGTLQTKQSSLLMVNSELACLSSWHIECKLRMKRCLRKTESDFTERELGKFS